MRKQLKRKISLILAVLIGVLCSRNVYAKDFRMITVDELQYSTVYGEWNASSSSINCYGFALGLDRSVIPGGLAGQTVSVHETNVNLVALYVKDDLRSIDASDRSQATSINTVVYNGPYECVKITAEAPSYAQMKANLSAISVRTGESGFHFMLYSSDALGWLHKPGASVQ